MNNERKIRIMRNALDTICSEAKEPIIKVYAQSALDETKDIPEVVIHNIHCQKHNWFGLPTEQCPECKADPPKSESNSKPISEGEQKSAEEILKHPFMYWGKMNDFPLYTKKQLQEYANQFKKEGEQLYRWVKASEPPKKRTKNLIVKCRNKAGNVYNNTATYDPKKIYAGSNWDVDNVTHWLEPIQGESNQENKTA